MLGEIFLGLICFIAGYAVCWNFNDKIADVLKGNK